MLTRQMVTQSAIADPVGGPAVPVGGAELVVVLVVLFFGLRLLAAMGAALVRLVVFLVAVVGVAHFVLGVGPIPFL